MEQTADPTAAQRLEGHVEVIQPQLPEERVQQHMMTRRQVPAVQDVQKPAEVPQALFVDRAMDIAVVQQGQMPMVQMMRTNAEMQQVHSLNKVVDVSVIMQRQVPTIWPIQTTVEVPHIQYIDKICGCTSCRGTAVRAPGSRGLITGSILYAGSRCLRRDAATRLPQAGSQEKEVLFRGQHDGGRSIR